MPFGGCEDLPYNIEKKRKAIFGKNYLKISVSKCSGIMCIAAVS
jgi:hypothetical protein